MSPSPALSTPWVPMWPVGTPPPIPTPVVDGYWLKGGPGGSMLWSAAPSPPPGYFTADTAWKIVGTDTPLTNGWVNYAAPYGPARYRKLSSGLVLLEGLIQTGTLGVTAFNLPAGWRPAKQQDGTARDYIFVCASAAGTAPGENLRVHSSGDVRPSGTGSNTWIDLSMVRFMADS